MRKFNIVLIAAICLICCQITVASEEKVFTIVVQNYKDFPPYSAYKSGEYLGFNREMLDLFATSKGYQFVYEAYPVKRLFHEFVQGTGDFKYPDNPKWAQHIKKQADIKYSDAVVEYIDGVMVIPENKGKGMTTLKKLGILAGWTPIQYLDAKKSGAIEITENSSYVGLLKQAMLGRIDGAYSNVATSRHYLDKVIKNKNALAFDPALPHIRAYRSLSSIKHPEIIEEFNVFLKQHSADIQQLKDKYRVEDGVTEQ